MHSKHKWREDAACKTAPVGIFFGLPTEQAHPKAEAKDYCRRCPVQQECLDFSIQSGEMWGIWGGLDEKSRRKLMRKLGMEAEA